MLTRSLIILVFTLSAFSCSRSVSRVAPDKEIDLSGRWNDSDSKLVADKMITEFMGSDNFKAYAKTLGRKPAIIVGVIRNKTSEHIDADTYVKKFELAIFNSGVADLVESDTFRDKIRVERADQADFSDPATVAQWGKEEGANLMLFGEMTSQTDVYNKKRVVDYVTTLYLTDMETSKRVWYGQEEIKKFIKIKSL